MNKFNYLGLSTPDLRKTTVFEFWYDYLKPKYGYNANFVIWNRQLHCSCISRQYLQRYCRRC